MRTQPRLTTRKLSPLSIRFDHALLFAAQVHRNQDRKKSGIPYLSHLMGVAAIVLDYGCASRATRRSTVSPLQR